jgi:DNA-binding SARP family transcriptional activator
MEFRILGPVQVWARGRSFPVGEPRQQAVLAALLVDAGRPVTVDTLVDRVWGDSPPPQARRSLQAHVAKIRRVLHGAAEADSDTAQPLVRDAGGYMIAADIAHVDALRFRDLVAQSHPATVEERQRVSQLREALELWRGEPLAGVNGAWAERMRRAWRQEHIDATLMWARAEIRLGNASTTLGSLTVLVEDYPTLESAAATLMRALYAAGRASDALDRYDDIRTRLRDELGMDPGPELRAAYHAVLRHDMTMLAGGPARPTEPAAPVPEPAAPVPEQLPADVPAFTGRTGELAELDRLVAESSLLCITGTAGVGKTALAVRWAHLIRGRFPDGQLYLNLRGYDSTEPMDPADALAMLLKVLAPGESPATLDLTERAARYRTAVAGRRMLIVLDNAATADQLRPLLPGTAGCVVVVTSRDTLAGLVAVHGARRIDLDLLPQPEAVALLQHLSIAAAETFVLLGLHPGRQFDSYAVAALVGGDRDVVRRTLDALTRANLVQQVGCDRFGIHDLLRSYATDLVTGPGSNRCPADLDAAVTRILDYYVMTAAAAMRGLYPGEADRWPVVPASGAPGPDLTVPAAARRWMDTELDNLLAVAAHGRPAHAVLLSTVLHRYLDGGHDAGRIHTELTTQDAPTSC